MNDTPEQLKTIAQSTKQSVPTHVLTHNPYIKAATTHNTRKAYRSDIRHYEQWGGALPTTAKHIVAYLNQYAETLSLRTLSRRLTALKQWHVYQHFPDPTDDPFVKKTLIGIGNVHGKPKNKAPAITAEQLFTIIQVLCTQSDLIALRDRALLQVGFFGAFRRSELVQIQFSDLVFSKKGVEIVIPRSKTDQQGEGQVCALPYGNEKLCPVFALKQWMERAEITEGPIFRAISRWGKVGETSLTAISVNSILKHRAAEAQLPNAELLSSHSLRRGLATSASLNGASIKAIMRQGRWQHVNTVLGYIEASQLFDDNAAEAVLKVKKQSKE